MVAEDWIKVEDALPPYEEVVNVTLYMFTNCNKL